MNGLKSVILQEFNKDKALAFDSFPFEALSLKMEPPPKYDPGRMAVRKPCDFPFFAKQRKN